MIYKLKFNFCSRGSTPYFYPLDCIFPQNVAAFIKKFRPAKSYLPVGLRFILPILTLFGSNEIQHLDKIIHVSPFNLIGLDKRIELLLVHIFQ